jgi:hypothetical protein
MTDTLDEDLHGVLFHCFLTTNASILKYLSSEKYFMQKVVEKNQGYILFAHTVILQPCSSVRWLNEEIYTVTAILNTY